MTTGIWVLGDQLWLGQAALFSFEQQRKQTPLILIESRSYAQRRPYHRQKLALVWSAMRHFAEELRSAGWPVTYEIADDFETPLLNWIKGNQITQVQVMAPNIATLLSYKSLGRMNLVLGNLRRMEAEELAKIQALAVDWRQKTNR